MLETWIDELTRVWGAVEDGAGRAVLSYPLFERDNFPAAVNVFPCALTFVDQVRPGMSEAAFNRWSGRTEFHLFNNADPSLLPAVARYYQRILHAVATNATLGGRVEYFTLDPEAGVAGSLRLQYGAENPHWGMIVNWFVIEEAAELVSG
jgi:hypothetical protein